MKTTKIFPVVLIAVAFFVASCVDNVVSPQVEAIRGQQVEWMKAKTATEIALAAMKTAEVDYQKALTDSLTKFTAFQEATRSWSLKNQELAYNLAKSQNDVALAQAQIDLATKQTALKDALAQLAVATAKSGSAEAQEYYNNYNDQISSLTQLYYDRVNIERTLNSTKINASDDINFATQQTSIIQANIADLNITLAAQNANLASLNLVVADPTSIQTTKNNLVNSNILLKIKLDSLNNVYTNYNSAANIANGNANAAQSIIITYTGYQTSLNTLIATTIPNQTAVVNDATTTLASKTDIYNQEKTNFDAKTDVYNTAKANRDAAKNDYDLKISATNIALANANNDVTDAKYIAAKAISDAAFIVLGTSTTILNAAITNMNTASIPYQSAKTALATAQANLKAANDAATTNGLAQVRLQQQISDLTSKYNDAVSKYPQYVQDALKSNAAITLVTSQMNQVSLTINANTSMINTLSVSVNTLSGVNLSITALKSQIANTVKLIADATTSLNGNADSKTLANDQIACWTKQLDLINTQITAVEKQAAYWKALLDKTFAA